MARIHIGTGDGESVKTTGYRVQFAYRLLMKAAANFKCLARDEGHCRVDVLHCTGDGTVALALASLDGTIVGWMSWIST